MPFKEMTKVELITSLAKHGVSSKFFDAGAIDAISSCHYHTVLSDVKAGAYTFEFFIATHVSLEQKGEPYTIGTIRLLAQSTYWRKATAMQQELERNIANGVIA